MENHMIYYLLFVNLTGFLLMAADKRKAKKKKWRIKESTLFAISILGGALGSLLGMYTFRHKTKHFKFTFGIPCILILNILSLVYILK